MTVRAENDLARLDRVAALLGVEPAALRAALRDTGSAMRIRPRKDPQRRTEQRRQGRRRAQNESADTATRHGFQWTGPEFELLAREDLTMREVATMTGRTLFAVRTMRGKLLRGDPRCVSMAGQPRVAARGDTLNCEFCLGERGHVAACPVSKKITKQTKKPPPGEHPDFDSAGEPHLGNWGTCNCMCTSCFVDDGTNNGLGRCTCPDCDDVTCAVHAGEDGFDLG